MNEMEIAFGCYKYSPDWSVTVLKFANFFAERKSSDLKQIPEADEYSKKKIVEMNPEKIIYDFVDSYEADYEENCETDCETDCETNDEEDDEDDEGDEYEGYEEDEKYEERKKKKKKNTKNRRR
jgi:hypothetical protein